MTAPTIVSSARLQRFGNDTDETISLATTPPTVKEVTDVFKTADKEGKKFSDVLKQLPVQYIVKEEKVDSMKKARELTDDEKRLIVENQLKFLRPLYPSLKRQLPELMESEDWAGIKNGHYYGALSSLFGSFMLPLVKDYKHVLNDAAVIFTAPLKAISDKWFDGKLIGDFHLNWDPIITSPGDSIQGAAIGAALGIPFAIASYYNQKQQNESIEEIMKRHEKNPTLLNVLQDEKATKLRDVWGQNNFDDNLERRLTNMFRINSLVPNILLPIKSGWVFPWNWLPFATATLKGVPLAGQLHEAVMAARDNNPDRVPSVTVAYTDPTNANRYVYTEAKEAVEATVNAGKAAGNAVKGTYQAGRWTREKTAEDAKDWFNNQRKRPETKTSSTSENDMEIDSIENLEPESNTASTSRQSSETPLSKRLRDKK